VDQIIFTGYEYLKTSHQNPQVKQPVRLYKKVSVREWVRAALIPRPIGVYNSEIFGRLSSGGGLLDSKYKRI